MSLADTLARGATALSKEIFGGAGQAPSTVDARIARLNAPKPVAAALPKGSGRNTRGAERFVPVHQDTFLTSSTGQQFPGRIINLSSLGVAIDADYSRFNPAQIVRAGTCRVRLGRTLLVGRVFLFEKPLSVSRCNRNIVL